MKRAPDASCLYGQNPWDTAGHTVFEGTYWDSLWLVVNAFVGNRNITPSDVQDLLFGPTEAPPHEND